MTKIECTVTVFSTTMTLVVLVGHSIVPYILVACKESRRQLWYDLYSTIKAKDTYILLIVLMSYIMN